MTQDLPTTYEPAETQRRITRRWLDADAFAAIPDERESDQRYVIMMPLPNVTGALHLGHAIDNVMQDLLIRWHRMQGKNALWQPGTDHAGIATQAVVEKRLYELEGKTRHDVGREALVKRIWAWKDDYQARIVQQQQEMGCSCDWQRQRFTMDPVCSAAVRATFFRLFEDRLISRGDRLVNWDCALQTAVSDDEVYHETVAGHFWHLRYPVIDPKPGEPTHVTVATTRPETMLGDTAVACHPDPVGALEGTIEEQRRVVAEASDKDRMAALAELARLEQRRKTHLPALIRLKEMAEDGRLVMLPLVERRIPLILDEWAKPELGSGCVKITPAHDQNDYDVWTRHADEIGIINILNPDGSLNVNAGDAYQGLGRFEARERVVEDLKDLGLLEGIEDREVEIGHSDRSRSAIEPYLSKQWFVRMGDVEGGVVFGRGTPHEFRGPGLAQAAIDAASGDWRTKTGRDLTFHPGRYQAQYTSWLSEKRDWCISRQLWWGHRIPVWTIACEDRTGLDRTLGRLPAADAEGIHLWVVDARGRHHLRSDVPVDAAGPFEIQACLSGPAAEATHAASLDAAGLTQDPDVLDTWFSSACWPFATLGWPDPAGARIGEGQRPLGGLEGVEDSFPYYYPGSCLVTARDIITLWVARMLMMGLYNHGDVPFTDCFVHANIQDGKGVRMSKSRGNGIDPVDIITRYGADAMRYVLCDLETGMQDVRLPVQAECPTCSKTVELATANHGKTIFTYLCTHCGSEFDVLGSMEDIPSATIISDRFDAGRNFCNKLWNAARFALLNLGEDKTWRPLGAEDLAPEDRWILSRLSRASHRVSTHLADYAPSAALAAAREFFWGELCDWYLELIKPRMRDEAQASVARQVLATVLDQVLRLLHPFLPFITESLWEHLGAHAPRRGIERELDCPLLALHAPWPERHEAGEDAALEAEFDRLRGAIRRIRDLRTRYTVPPKQSMPVAIRAPKEVVESLEHQAHLLEDLARIDRLELGEEVTIPPNAATQVFEEMEIFLGGVLDPEKEKVRLAKQMGKLEQGIRGVEAKLSNEKFLARAPGNVVEAERTRLADLRAQLDILEKSLHALEKGA